MKSSFCLDWAPLTTLELRGLESDNVLAILAMLGLLRAIEESQPDWAPRIEWMPAPWRAVLHLNKAADNALVARAAYDGLAAVMGRLERHRPRSPQGPMKDVSFTLSEFRAYALETLREPSEPKGDSDPAQLAACLASEWPLKKDDAPIAGPLVMMFGQGHQHFLERYFGVPCAGVDDSRDVASGSGAAVRAIHSALFEPWTRGDETNGFRWDPEDDQRYALRFSNPSRAGAAPTQDGANRLATLGFLSFPSFPAGRATARGCRRDRDGVSFVWPIWNVPLSLRGIESLLSHPAVLKGHISQVRNCGVCEIVRARRVSNGKFLNVTRAMPFAETEKSRGEKRG